MGKYLWIITCLCDDYFYSDVARLNFRSLVISNSAETIFVFISSFAWLSIPHGEIIALFPPLERDREIGRAHV